MSRCTVGLWLATVTAVSWAVLAIALKVALHTFTSGTIVFLRLVVAFAILFVGFAWKNHRQLSILYRPPWLGLLCGALIAFNYFGFMKGVELTTASNAQIMIQLAPLTLALASIFLFREVPTLRQTLGMLTALAGFGFFYWDQILQSWAQIERFQAGNLWVVAAAATWAGFALLQKALLKKFAPQQFNVLIYAVATLCLLPTAHLGELSLASPWYLVLVLFLALNTVAAYGAFSEALLRAPASHVSMIIAVNPLLTLALMSYLAQLKVQWIKPEPIGWRGLVGAFLVVVGVIYTVASPPRLSREGDSLKIKR